MERVYASPKIEKGPNSSILKVIVDIHALINVHEYHCIAIRMRCWLLDDSSLCLEVRGCSEVRSTSLASWSRDHVT